MTPVRVSRVARKDLRSIVIFHAEVGGFDAACSFRDSVDALKRTLAEHPEAYALRPNLGSKVRGAVVGAHLVVYIRKSEEVVILRILHGRRDLGPDFRRLT